MFGCGRAMLSRVPECAIDEIKLRTSTRLHLPCCMLGYSVASPLSRKESGPAAYHEPCTYFLENPRRAVRLLSFTEIPEGIPEGMCIAVRGSEIPIPISFQR
ncbi:hypothetical protein HN011_011854 [Eciton burchellii]|nr:hypothetical protein HN011_011854 [Eciton burchellii]